MTLVLGTAVNMHNITQYSTVQYSTQYSSKYAHHWSELFTFLLNTPLVCGGSETIVLCLDVYIKCNYGILLKQTETEKIETMTVN